jgi:hypothetical protein
MKNYELIIDDKLSGFDFEDIDSLFFKLYGADPSISVGIEKLDLLFACYHERLYSLIAPLSKRIKEKGQQTYYWADASRSLIKAIDDIFELQSAFKGTCYNFTISQECSNYLKYIRPFLKMSGGSLLPEGVKSYDVPKYEKVFMCAGQCGSDVKAEPTIDEIIQMVSTRGSTYDQMKPDEKLEVLANLIENLLKKDGKFKKVDSDKVFCGLMADEDIMAFRRKMQCFRHVTKEDIEERKIFTKEQKEFLANYGLTICMAILDNSNRQ